MELFGANKKNKIVDLLIFALVACVMFAFANEKNVHAAQGTVEFGSETYETYIGEEFYVNVNINSETEISSYEIRVKYDNERLSYVQGADAEQDGLLILSGEGFGRFIQYTLQFEPISGGEAGIMVTSAALMAEGEEAASVVDSLDRAPIVVDGADTTGVSFFEKQEISAGSNAAYYTDSGIPLVKKITDANGKEYRVVDVENYKPDTELWKYNTGTVTYGGVSLPCISDADENVKVLVAIDENEAYSLFAVSADGNSLYTVGKIEAGGETYYCISSNACLDKPVISAADGGIDQVFYGINANGQGGFYKYSLSGKMIAWDDDMDADGLEVTDEAARADVNADVSKVMAAIVAIVIIGLATYFIVWKRKHRKDTGTGSVSDMTSNERRKQYIFVIRELTSREIKRKYARSFLGIIWSVLNPLLTMTVMSLIFSYMFKRSIEMFPLYYLTGSIFWTLFSGATNSAMTALVDNKNLLLKVKLPKRPFVLSRVYTSLINFGYTCIAYVLMLAVFRIRPSWLMLLFFLDVVLMFMFATGIGYILSILYVFFADIKYLYSVLLTLVMYCSAIFYPVTSLPEVLQKLISYNPIYMGIYIARECVVYNNVPDISAWIKLLIVALVSLGLGRYVFKKKQNDVMQMI